jgi:hypothetical protein
MQARGPFPLLGGTPLAKVARPRYESSVLAPPRLAASNPDDVTSDGPLVAANRAVHHVFDRLHEDVFLALMRADLAAARAAWRDLGRALEAHQQVEEPALAAHPSPHPPRGGSAELVLAEHARLNLLWAQGSTLLDELATSTDADTLPRAIVRSLDRLLRLHHLLDHHGEREHHLVYPDLEARLSPAEALALAAALREAAVAFTSAPEGRAER